MTVHSLAINIENPPSQGKEKQQSKEQQESAWWQPVVRGAVILVPLIGLFGLMAYGVRCCIPSLFSRDPKSKKEPTPETSESSQASKLTRREIEETEAIFALQETEFSNSTGGVNQGYLSASLIPFAKGLFASAGTGNLTKLFIEGCWFDPLTGTANKTIRASNVAWDPTAPTFTTERVDNSSVIVLGLDSFGIGQVRGQRLKLDGSQIGGDLFNGAFYQKKSLLAKNLNANGPLVLFTVERGDTVYGFLVNTTFSQLNNPIQLFRRTGAFTSHTNPPLSVNVIRQANPGYGSVSAPSDQGIIDQRFSFNSTGAFPLPYPYNTTNMLVSGTDVGKSALVLLGQDRVFLTWENYTTKIIYGQLGSINGAFPYNINLIDTPIQIIGSDSKLSSYQSTQSVAFGSTDSDGNMPLWVLSIDIGTNKQLVITPVTIDVQGAILKRPSVRVPTHSGVLDSAALANTDQGLVVFRSEKKPLDNVNRAFFTYGSAMWPVLNQFNVTNGTDVVVSTNPLAKVAFSWNSTWPNDEIIYRINFNQSCKFYFLQDLSKRPLTAFGQTDLMAGKIWFAHDGNNSAPSFSGTVESLDLRRSFSGNVVFTPVTPTPFVGPGIDTSGIIIGVLSGVAGVTGVGVIALVIATTTGIVVVAVKAKNAKKAEEQRQEMAMLGLENLSQLIEQLRKAYPHNITEVTDITIIKKLGQGGQAGVFEVEVQGKKYAYRLESLKFDSDVETFIKTIGVLFTLRHPNIGTIQQFVFNEGRIGYLMELGIPLKDVLNKEELMPKCRFRIFNILWGIMSALEHTHSKGVFHRDIKADNIVLREDGQPMIIDWGLVKKAEKDVTMTLGVGTQPYLAPSTLDGKYDGKDDVYSAGEILYRLITKGKEMYPPVEGYKHDTIVQYRNLEKGNPMKVSKPKLPSDTPPWLRELFRQCMSRFRDKRPTPAEFREVLRQHEKELDEFQEGHYGFVPK